MNRRCPVCKKGVVAPFADNAGGSDFLPFCSERCKLVDLGAWLEEEYKITSQIGSRQDEETCEFI